MADDLRNSVNVVLRLRPFVAHEKEKGCTKVVHKVRSTSSEEVVQVNQKTIRYFEFDAVLDETNSQKDVYYKSGAYKAVTDDIFRGFNTTICAYGQSGSGKTFTMGTTTTKARKNRLKFQKTRIIRETSGVIPRACADLFEQIRKQCNGDATVEMSYLEVYNEEIRDLLTANQCHDDLQIREDTKGEVFVQGLATVPVTSPLEVGKLMDEANTRRVVASTKINDASSRSHAICIITIQGNNSENVRFRSRLTLVDLAGSERLAKTENTGFRRTEGININRGLFVLGLVISALTEKRPHLKRHPPFRESKLTRLLQNSLGGNSRTIMIACCSPADYHAEETVNTLRYATQARSIENPATANIIHDSENSEQFLALQVENEELRRENELLKQQLLDYQQTIQQITAELTDVGSEVQDVIQDIAVKNADGETRNSIREYELRSQRPGRIQADSATETTFSELTSDGGSESKEPTILQITAGPEDEIKEETTDVLEMEQAVSTNNMLVHSPLSPLEAMALHLTPGVAAQEKSSSPSACGYESWNGPSFDQKRLSCKEWPSDEQGEVMMRFQSFPFTAPAKINNMPVPQHGYGSEISRNVQETTKSMKQAIAESFENTTSRRGENEEKEFAESPSEEKPRKKEGTKSSSYFDKAKWLSAFNCSSGTYGLQEISKFKYYS